MDVLHIIDGLRSEAAHADLLKAIDSTLTHIERAVAIFGLEHLCFSFNGGKDSLVVLHLLRAFLERSGHTIDALRIVYFETKNLFAEMETFFNDISAEYVHINMCKPIKFRLRTVMESPSNATQTSRRACSR